MPSNWKQVVLWLYAYSYELLELCNPICLDLKQDDDEKGLWSSNIL